VAMEENGFLEYVQLQGGTADLVTKSELIHAVRSSGYSLSNRQLTFYARGNRAAVGVVKPAFGEDRGSTDN
jgi:hypothetical protein